MSRRGSARLTFLAAPLTLALALGLTACGDGGEEPSTDTTSTSSPSETPSPSEETEPSEEPEPTEELEGESDAMAIDVTRENDRFTPNGERVDVEIGQPLTITITSDVAGELHVHSVPEQEIAYDAGTSEHEITIDRPGVVEVESHEPDLIVLQLEVR